MYYMGTHIENVSEFIKWAFEVKKHFKFDAADQWTPWFRGQNKEWYLCPKLYRDEFGDSARRTRWDIEDEIREEFIIRAPAFFESVSAPVDEWGWYFLMQHYGAPTRLLDWTDGALLALYFAVKDSQGLTNAVVWALDPYELNKNVSKKKEWVICPDAKGVSEKDMKLVNDWLPQRFMKRKTTLPSLPIAVYPTHIARRISTQRSGFTIHGNNPRGLEAIAKRYNNILTKVIIPAFKAQAIRKELEACGIDESTVFPDLDGLGQSLCQRWRMDIQELPHESVLTRLHKSQIDDGGVGVFAIKEIKKGTRLFQGDIDEMLWIDEDQIPKGPREIRALYNDFAVIDKERHYGCPKNFNRLTMAWYINEARNGRAPNVRGDPETYEFYALRNIHKGEELITKYDDYSERPKDTSAG